MAHLLDIWEEHRCDGGHPKDRDNLHARDRETGHGILPEGVNPDTNLAKDETQDVVLYGSSPAIINISKPLGSHPVHTPGEQDTRDCHIGQSHVPDVKQDERAGL